ncbi:MAG: phosphate regulon sensor histidine kinase PhoR [Inhella sp.]|jgi:two-component system phosphate regulon sensor histidine kinase PhoR|uniref:phosphate regulon sensor histidine kinase PhoR n=1 Tax=Inhella sp. TaxID=1921806 RepID=UPI0022BD9D18|nr:phosphate regulon sensor histidine kinase PhoR [Inhella sp.]MCZ8233838.1 phosphate regulon sensor histidine kinase PhoR [Inhella sp.]
MSGAWWCAALAVGAASLWALDRWRLHRLLRWVGRDPAGPAPRLHGAHAELAYRVEKALRVREARAQRERQRREQFLQALEAYPNGLVLLDADDHIQWLNHVSGEHLGLDLRRDLQQNVRNLVRVPAFVELLSSPNTEGQTQIALHNGSLKLALSLRRYGDDGRGPMSLLVSQDITESARMERMRRDFVANVSHEIRSPLTVLSGFLESLQALDLTGDERQRIYGLMQQQSQRMQSLVTDLLTLAQLEGSPPPTTESRFALRPLLERLLADARALDDGHHPLEAEGWDDAEGWHLAGPEGEWHSAFANLVSNALRYTPGGGRVQLRWCALPDGGGEFAVQDEGVGIAAEHLPRLTERFYRVDASRSRGTGGTGLGLAIVKHVLQRHGAELDIQSQPGQGSRFAIRIPASQLRR